ncbi:DUF5050 domain-containing protein [Butyrivibrio sp. NC2002]|uniref:DUF5050 domain-containing protein n=1 Tax=Butyrivibrio sp. NC2002 TaxID=1410610 RepID=UPI0009DCA0EF|nr:DUF5050 domain-containing protein [Butyrivibrio sp. NC2002]
MTSKRNIIFLSILGVAFVAIITFLIISEHIPMNDENVVGNNPGNLYNGGLFLELDGTVYFSNPLNHDCLYSMTPDETNLKPLTMMSVRNITGSGKFLYFYMDNSNNSAPSDINGLGKVSTYYGLYRSNLKGEDQVLMSWNKISDLQLVGSTVYYTILPGVEESGLNSVRIDGKNKKFITTEQLNPSCALNGSIYYTGVDLDHNLHQMDTLADNATHTVMEGNIWQPIVKGDYVYYIDAKHHYRLVRTSLSTNETEVLTNSRIDFYNMNDYNIFYATSESGNQTLRVMGLDGSGNTVIAEGVFNSLNLTSKYLYFKPFEVDNVIYHVPVDGSAPYSTFRDY